MAFAMKRFMQIISLVLLAALMSGCVYYNTFFIARKNFNKAERLRKKAGGDAIPATAKPFYDKAIEKASKVLAYYNDTDYVDDALYLLGMCFLRTGDYTKALRKYNELLDNFPDSKFAEDSRYWRSVCLFYGGQEELAVDSLEAIAAEFPERADEAMYMIAELTYQKGDLIESKTAFLTFLEKFPSSQYAPRAHMRLGQIAWKFEEYENAAEHFEKVSEGDVPTEDYYTVRSRLAQCYVKIKRLDDAQKVCDALLKDESYMTHWGDVELIVGDIAYARGDIEKAKGIWEKLADKYARTETGAWAYYRLGEMYYAMGDLKTAKEMFDIAAQQVSSGEVRELALRRSAIVARFLAYRQNMSGADSLGTSIVATELKLAEMYLTELNEPDSAINAYRHVLTTYPNDSLAPKAAYAMGWVYANSKKNFNTADSVFSALLAKYPESDYAVGGADYFKSRGGSLDSLAARNVAYYFIKAEEYWLTYNWLDSAITFYSIVIDSFPQSRWVPRAMAAKAEMLSEQGRLDDAKAMYALISQKYAGTAFDSLAKAKSGEKVVAIKHTGAQPKDTFVVASVDTGKAGRPTPVTPTYNDIPRAPRPKKPSNITLFYPEQEWSSRMKGKKVRLKVKIDAFGKITESELLSTCGNAVIDDAAFKAIKHVEFNPADIDITLFNTWFLLDIPVQEPPDAPFWEEPGF